MLLPGAAAASSALRRRRVLVGPGPEREVAESTETGATLLAAVRAAAGRRLRSRAGRAGGGAGAGRPARCRLSPAAPVGARDPLGPGCAEDLRRPSLQEHGRACCAPSVPTASLSRGSARPAHAFIHSVRSFIRCHFLDSSPRACLLTLLGFSFLILVKVELHRSGSGVKAWKRLY